MNLKWSYSSSKGFYIGFKATVIIDYDSMNPVSILIHSGAPNDAKLFDEIMETLQKRRIIQKEEALDKKTENIEKKEEHSKRRRNKKKNE